MSYEALKVSFQDTVCSVQIDLPAANNTINDTLIRELSDVLVRCEESVTVIVLSGTPEVFCLGADFESFAHVPVGDARDSKSPEALYDLWLKMTTGPYITVSHVCGRANAGGLGFIAASDIALASETAQFSLSELLFGLYPACVLPFLVRRIGFQRAHYLTLTTESIRAAQAYEWGLVDAFHAQSDVLVRRHLSRLKRISKTAIRRYKNYLNRLAPSLTDLRAGAVAANREIFSDANNLAAISRYVTQGIFPWEKP